MINKNIAVLAPLLILQFLPCPGFAEDEDQVQLKPLKKVVAVKSEPVEPSFLSWKVDTLGRVRSDGWLRGLPIITGLTRWWQQIQRFPKRYVITEELP